jgi:hypothetical protein
MMTMTRRAFLGRAAAIPLCASAGRALAFGQAARPSDAALLRDALTTLHPGLHRYLSPPAFAAAFASFERAFGESGGLADRYLALSRLTGLIRCGHSHPNPFNQRRAVAETLFAPATRLPFRFRWIGSRMIVTDGQQSGLVRGAEILSIDGIPASRILADLLPLARADGGNDAKRRRLLSVEGEQRIETFDILHPLLHPPRGDHAELLVRSPAGRRNVVRLGRIDLAARQAAMPAGGGRPQGNPGWTLRHEGRGAIMTMPDWALYNSDWDWRGWIAAAFDEMASRDSRLLILDLRANEGGLDCGDPILARSTDRPLARGGWRRRTRFRTAPERLLPYLDTWNRSFDRIGENGVDRGDGFFELPDGDDREIAPQGPRFMGRLAVLTGPQNSSATFNFANIVQANRLGVLIGEPTGGNRRGINGGAYYFLRLPESGLEVDIPLIGYFPPTPQPDAGLLPDSAAPATAASIAAGRDPAMARALALLQT